MGKLETVHTQLPLFNKAFTVINLCATPNHSVKLDIVQSIAKTSTGNIIYNTIAGEKIKVTITQLTMCMYMIIQYLVLLLK